MPSLFRLIARCQALLACALMLVSGVEARAQFLSQLTLNPINNTTVQLGSTLSITVSVANTDVPFGELEWSIPSGPGGVSITNDSVFPNSADLTWTPAPSQAPSTNNITVQVSDIFNPVNTTSSGFQVIVLATTNTVSGPPEVNPIADQDVAVGQLLTLTATAHTTDGTANALTFSLDPDSDIPAGASINPATGVFTWTPTADQADIFTIGVIASEQATGLSSDPQLFTVNVIVTNNCESLNDLLDAVANGGVVMLTNCPTLVLSNTITIDTDVTLDAGTGNVVITGNNLLRLFEVSSTGSLTLIGVTLSGGQSTSGGALFVEDGGVVTVSNCLFRANNAVGTNGVSGANGGNTSGNGGNGGSGTSGVPACGGAIYNAGDLTVLFSQFLTNSASGGDGGNGGTGGNGPYQGGNGGKGGNGGSGFGAAIYNIGTLLIDSTTFDGNTVSGGNGGTGGNSGTGAFAGLTGAGGSAGAGSGAALYNTNDAVVINSTFSNNSATGGDSAAGGSDNIGQTGSRGGEGSGAALYNKGTLAVTNCTLYANTVLGGAGGNGGSGVYSGGNGGSGGNGLGAAIYSLAGDAEVVNCTIALNQARGGTNGVAGSGGFGGTDGSMGAGHGAGIARGGGIFYFQNSILVTNAPGTNAYGTITDGGSNLSSDSSLKGTSRKKIDPKLGPLQNNGGATKTMALSKGSPAIDAANDSAAPETDQRGVPRPVGPASDIGSYETTTSTAPAIQGQPQSQVATNGASVTFRVSALGDNLAYQWRFYGTNTTATNITGATSSSYVIPAAGPTNAGKYDVIVSNPLGSVTSHIATLTLGVAPAFVSTPTNQTVVPGTNITLTASATGDPPLTFQWKLNGTNLVGATNSVLTLTNIQTNNAGSYTVSVSNKTGIITSPPAVVTVDTAERFTISGHVFNGTNGESGVTVGTGTNSALTDVTGAYTITGVHAGDYFIFADKSGLNFGAPVEVIVGPNATNVNFTAIQPKYTISGRVLLGNAGLSGVTLIGGQTNDANGNFQLSFGPGSYKLVPTKAGFSFSPSTLTVTLPPDATNLVFMAGSHLSIKELANGNVVLSVAGSGRWRVESSTNLIDWVSIYTNLASFSFTNTTTSAASLFYRAVQP